MQTDGETFFKHPLLFGKSQTSKDCEQKWCIFTNAGVQKQRDWEACITKMSKRRSITTALLWCFAGFTLCCSKAKKKRGWQSVSSPCESAARVQWSRHHSCTPTRGNPETERREKSFWHLSSFIKSSCVAALYACPFQNPQIFRLSLEIFLLLRNLEACFGVRRLVILVGGESWACVCLAAAAVDGRGEERRVDWRAAVHLWVTSHLHTQGERGCPLGTYSVASGRRYYHFLFWKESCNIFSLEKERWIEAGTIQIKAKERKRTSLGLNSNGVFGSKQTIKYAIN